LRQTRQDHRICEVTPAHRRETVPFKHEITKRQLGAALMAIGVVVIGGVFAYDLLKRHAIGDRFQLVGLALGVLLVFLGIALLLLGADPA